MKNSLIGLSYALLLFCVILNSCQSENDLNYARYFVNGKQIYEQHCENCHGKNGQGLEAQIPALSDTTFLKQNKNRLACMIRYGLSDTVTVNGTVYQGKMPAEGHLANIDIAQVITFITNSFGNKQGLHDAEDVVKDLKDCR